MQLNALGFESFFDEQPSLAKSAVERGCQGSRSDPKGLSLTSTKTALLVKEGRSSEKEDESRLMQICVQINGGDTIGYTMDKI